MVKLKDIARIKFVYVKLNYLQRFFHKLVSFALQFNVIKVTVDA